MNKADLLESIYNKISQLSSKGAIHAEQTIIGTYLNPMEEKEINGNQVQSFNIRSHKKSTTIKPWKKTPKKQ